MGRELAIITGGTSGIGFGIAEALAPQYDLALIHGTNVTRAEAAVKSLRAKHPTLKVNSYAREMFTPADCEEVYKLVQNDFAAEVAVLVNGAGRIRDQLFTISNMEFHQAVINEHLTVPIAFTRLVIPSMYKRKSGRIINVGSISAHRPNMGQTSYSAAKAGIEAFSKTLALEVARRGITVNVVAPGLIETPMTEDLMVKMGPDPAAKIPVGFVGQPSDVANAVKFLCSEDARYITGAVLTIDGGRSLSKAGGISVSDSRD